MSLISDQVLAGRNNPSETDASFSATTIVVSDYLHQLRQLIVSQQELKQNENCFLNCLPLSNGVMSIEKNTVIKSYCNRSGQFLNDDHII